MTVDDLRSEFDRIFSFLTELDSCQLSIEEKVEAVKAPLRALQDRLYKIIIDGARLQTCNWKPKP